MHFRLWWFAFAGGAVMEAVDVDVGDRGAMAREHDLVGSHVLF